ncbi:MAG TPA: OmpA family protein [Tepidisphaeraceae bacterium]|nr:OmpA family protein [Tepidisphaeraceae bacterium]
MQRSWLITVVVAFLGAGAVGCQDALKQENMELRQELKDRQAKLDDAEARLKQAPDPGQMAQMQQDIAARDAKIAELQNQLQQPAPGQARDNSLSGIEVTRDDRAGTMTVNLPGDVLFASGEADLKPSAKITLNKVVAAINKDYKGRKIMVYGHTDSDPISRTKDKWKDNLDLSAARARTVAHFLIEQGVDQRNVTMRAYGETLPKGSKPQSRRVEIVVATR